jgi:hypothetical protein
MSKFTISISLDNEEDVALMGYSDGAVEVELATDDGFDFQITLTKDFIESLSELSFEAQQ